MKPFVRPVSFALALLGALACGGSTAQTGGDADAGAGGEGGGGGACTPSAHRAAAKTCAPSSAPPLPYGGSPPACATDADCATAGSGYSTCLGGRCAFDACLSDADCAGGGLCGCSTDYGGGNAAYHPNVCVPATCHVDSDCGTGVCAPTLGRCGSLTRFDCAPSNAPACSSTQSCSYAPEVGAFACTAPTVCNG